MDAGNVTPDCESISEYVERHTTDQLRDPANPAAGSVSDIEAIGQTVKNLSRVGSVAKGPDIRGGLQLSVGPSSITGAVDFRLTFGLQTFHY